MSAGLGSISSRLSSASLGRSGRGWGRTLSLRARVITAFALGTGLLSAFLAISTYVVVRQALLDQREELAARQTYVNARLVRSGLRTPRTDVPRLLGSLENPTGSEALIAYQGNWFSSDLQASQGSLPRELLERVTEGTPARMVFDLGDGPHLAIGVPVPAVQASYFEISTLDELDKTLGTLQLTLVGASIVTALGGAALGWYASRVVLHPVTEAASAAEAIAAGDMTTRLVPDGDKELDRLVLSFNRMVDALQRRIERDARFASDVSHELRSPLMTLVSGVTVLQSRRHELPPRSQTALDLLADEIDRFQRMVQDLLEISRGDAGHTELVREEVLAGEFVRRVVEYAQAEIPVDEEGDSGEAILSVDKRRMERVIGNLLENADRYAGGVIRIGLRPAGMRLRIEVDDAGPGVPADERDRIFERFARGMTARARASGEGTGLGLSLVDEHVRLHGGRVWVEDRPGGGARFVVELPREEP